MKRQEEARLQAEAERYQDYMRKKQEIEELKALREVELEKSGKAMRDAEEAEERRLRDEIERKEKALRDAVAVRTRGKAALERERQLQAEKRELEEALRQVERKKQVWAQEALIAHDNAGRFREH